MSAAMPALLLHRTLEQRSCLSCLDKGFQLEEASRDLRDVEGLSGDSGVTTKDALGYLRKVSKPILSWKDSSQ